MAFARQGKSGPAYSGAGLTAPEAGLGPQASRRNTGMKKQPRIRIGISGWQYAGWRGVFYPPGLGAGA
jgi:hypothetical protein